MNMKQTFLYSALHRDARARRRLILTELLHALAVLGACGAASLAIDQVFLEKDSLSTTAPVLLVLFVMLGALHFIGLWQSRLQQSLSGAVRKDVREKLHARLLSEQGQTDQRFTRELLPLALESTDALDALGNTTAATGKGFAIGSAALTALALLASYIEEIKIAMVRAFEGGKQYIDAAGNAFDPTQASTIDFINFFEVNLINPKVLVGAFLGAMAAFLFCGLTMGAVGRAAESMVQEVRRQFREIKGILEGKATPDYGRCVEISTRSAQREMIIPSFLAIVIPIVVGLVLGVAGVLGLLTGGLAAGFTLAVFMSNSGGAWDNAKKMIEEGNFGGKGSENHKATVVGDTVGDPFKDTSGPSLNILIKLMSMVSIVMAGLTIAFL